MKTLLRNTRIALALGLGAFMSMFAVVAMAAWPNGPVRIIMPAAPGGSSDPLARVTAQELEKQLGESFIVENKPGANGNLGASSVAKAKPDGQTLLFSWTGTLVSAVTLYHSKPFDPVKDFEPIVMIGAVPNVVITSGDLPVKNMQELTEYIKSHPDKLSFGSTGSGSSWHLSGELYKKLEGVSMEHVPYTSSSTALTDLMAGRLQVMFPGTAAVVPFLHDKKMRILAIMDESRMETLPGIPTTKEQNYPDLKSASWFALLAPKGTPREVTDKINAIINSALKRPEFRNKLIQMGYIPLGGTSNEFANYMAAEIVKWNDVVKFSGAKID